VSPFVLSQRLKTETKSRFATGRSTKRPSTLNGIYILFYLQADHKKKIGYELIYLFFFSCSYIKITFFKFAVFNVSINY
jgi:hypothetical protein